MSISNSRKSRTGQPIIESVPGADWNIGIGRAGLREPAAPPERSDDYAATIKAVSAEIDYLGGGRFLSEGCSKQPSMPAPSAVFDP